MCLTLRLRRCVPETFMARGSAADCTHESVYQSNSEFCVVMTNSTFARTVHVHGLQHCARSLCRPHRLYYVPHLHLEKHEAIQRDSSE